VADAVDVGGGVKVNVSVAVSVWVAVGSSGALVAALVGRAVFVGGTVFGIDVVGTTVVGIVVLGTVVVGESVATIATICTLPCDSDVFVLVDVVVLLAVLVGVVVSVAVGGIGVADGGTTVIVGVLLAKSANASALVAAAVGKITGSLVGRRPDKNGNRRTSRSWVIGSMLRNTSGVTINANNTAPLINSMPIPVHPNAHFIRAIAETCLV
jgi:hypothetical protein